MDYLPFFALLDVKRYSISKPSGLAGNALTPQHPVAEPAGPLCLWSSPETKVQAGKQLFLKGSQVPLIY